MKDKLFTIRMSAQRLSEFIAAADLRGVNKSALVNHFITQLIRDEKALHGASFQALADQAFARLKQNKRADESEEIPEEPFRVTGQARYLVLQRDGFRCKFCGRSPQDGNGSIGITLHVDHIQPLSKGGTTTLDNMQTLCNDCNSGKSDLV